VWPKHGEQRPILAPDYSVAAAINAAEIVAGVTWEYPWEAFEWDSKRGSLTFLAEAMDINDKAEILGLVDYRDGTGAQLVIWRIDARH
jgi:hypothetical protein